MSPMPAGRAKPHVQLALLSVSCLLYAFSLRAYYVGFFNDDAFYIIGARSLTQGRYVELSTPGAPPSTGYLPGYPLLLAPLAYLFPEGLLPYQLLSILLTLGAVLLCWRLWDGLSPAARLSAALLAALNPLTVSLSGTVLADIPFFLIVAGTLLLGRRAWDSDRTRDWVLLALASACAFYFRPTGAALPLALVGALLLEKRRRRAALCASIAFPLLAAFPLRNRLLTGNSLLYATEFSDPYAGAGALTELAVSAARNLAFYPRELFVRVMFRWPEGPWSDPLEALTVAACLSLCVLGVRRGRGAPRDRFSLLYLACYSGAHLAWSKQSGRYLLGVFPLAFAYLFAGLDWLEARLKKRGLVLGALALSAALCLRPLAGILEASLLRTTPVNTPPRATFSWIKANTSPEDVFAAELDGRVYLHTGRRAFRLPHIEDAAALSGWLRSRGVAYVLVFPTDMMLKTRSGTTRHDPLDVSGLTASLDASGFSRVFSDPKEGSAIYRVPKS